jgi:alkyl hydroperoxide reductase subunit AhpF
MSILKIYEGRAVRAALAEVVKPVQITYLALEQPEPDTIEALADLTALTPFVSVNVQQESAGEADRVIVRGENGGELVFLGPPVGTELAALVSAVVVAGRGYSGLSTTTCKALTRLNSPVHVRIFTSPS